MSRLKLIAIVGPSGAGKTTLMKKIPWLKQLPSVTTRSMRDGEVEGNEYVFIPSVEKFEQMIKDGELLEHVNNYGNYYGLSKTIVDDLINSDDSKLRFIIVTDPGYQILKNYMPEGSLMSIFLYASYEDCKGRLIDRGDNRASMEKRLMQYYPEVSLIKNYDYIVANPTNALDQAVKTISTIISYNVITSDVLDCD